MSGEEREPVDITILYADGSAYLGIETFKDGSKNYVNYLEEIEQKRRIEKLKEELAEALQRASMTDCQDYLIKARNDLVDIYEIMPLHCPICGKLPKKHYYKNDFHVWELRCCNLFGKSHFVAVGKPFRPYCEAVLEWNKQVDGWRR